MDSLSGYISGTILIFGLAYIFYLHPKFEDKRDMLIFDNRVLGYVDGLFYTGKQAGIKFRCTASELRNYTTRQLSEAHKLPDNQSLVEYKTQKGWHYCSHTGPNDYALFALLCIAEYAKCIDNDELVSFCESMMLDASRFHLHTIQK